MARAEKARPVAVDRKACGAVNWMQATRSVSGPEQPMPVKAVKMICSVPQLGLMKAKHMDAMNMMANVTARGVSVYGVSRCTREEDDFAYSDL